MPRAVIPMWRNLFARLRRETLGTAHPKAPLPRLLLCNPSSPNGPSAIEQLLTVPAYARCFDEACRHVYTAIGWAPREWLAGVPAPAHLPHAVPLGLIELIHQFALHAALVDAGVGFDAVAGISVGEAVAAHASGASDLSTAVSLASHFLVELGGRDGDMGVVQRPVSEVWPAIRHLPLHLVSFSRTYTAIAALNVDRARIDSEAAARGVQIHWLQLGVVTHTPLVDVKAIQRAAKSVVSQARKSRLPFFSSLTGKLHCGQLDARYCALLATRPSRVSAMADAIVAYGVKEVILLGSANLKAEIVAAAAVAGCAPPRFRTAISVLRERLRCSSFPAPVTFDDPAAAADPYSRMQAWRSCGRLVPLSSPKGWLVLDHATACEILRRPDQFSSSPFRAYFGVLHGADPPEHTRLRRILSAHFSTAMVAAYVKPTAELAHARLAALRAVPVFDLVEEFLLPVILELNRRWLGLKLDMAKRLHAEPFVTLDPEVIFAALEKEGLLVELRADSRVSAHELAELAPFLLTAGVTTLQDFAGLSIQSWLTDPSQAEALRADRSALQGWLEERLRLDPPVQTLMRQVVHPTTLAGTRLEPGEVLYVSLAGANRDPGVFVNPDSPDPDRNQASSLSFGLGPHYCLGHQFARAHGVALFNVLLDVWPSIAVADPDKPVAWKHNVVMRGLASLPMRWRAMSATS